MREAAYHLALLLLFPPLIPGVIARVKAWAAGRAGPPLFQAYFDVWKLLRKGAVYSRTTTWVFRAGPVVSLAAVLTSGLLVPLGAGRPPLGFAGDVVAFAALLGLARFATIAAALDTGSSFEGMGASREAAFSMLAEPALFLALAILCLLTGGVSLGDLGAGWGEWPAVLACACALFAVLLAENSRIPVDDPNTHLELTMIHEVMVLDHGGPDLAFILYGSAVKLFVIGAVLAHAVLPFPARGGWPGASLMICGQFGIAVAVGLVESAMARLRLTRVPQFLLGASALAAVGLAALLYGRHP